MATKVLVLGGGIAGLSAAHELAERGFEVEVLEAQSVPGGKARSLQTPSVPGGPPGPLPGEHGFRFFPRFYKHIIDTMKRIPYSDNRHGVYDNLVDTTRMELARYDHPPVISDCRFPHSLSDLKSIISGMYADVGVTLEDKEFFAEKCWQIMTSCRERRMDEYEHIGWWDFVGASSRSAAYQAFFGVGLTRSLVAAKATSASTRTIGDIGVQLLFDILTPGVSCDRVLNGPTNVVWIDPWLTYLRGLGVQYHLNAPVVAIDMQGGQISGVRATIDGQPVTKTADYYVAAVPLEVMTRFITPDMTAVDPRLGLMPALAANVSSMNGIQFFLKQDVPLANGHSLFLDAQWALTSVSQRQFWTHGLEAFAGTGVGGILSVDISEWAQPGLNGKTACQCSRDEIAAETWAQLKRSLNTGDVVLTDDNLHSWFLDPDIQEISAEAGMCEICKTVHPLPKRNREPLLVNLINTWALRPDSYTRIPNLLLASDYVRTNTDLATMEGANEAARRAVNTIIDRSKSDAALCEIWEQHEPDILAPWRKADFDRWQRGLPWSGTIEPEWVHSAIEWVRRHL